jgi:hypothetical protein
MNRRQPASRFRRASSATRLRSISYQILPRDSSSLKLRGNM